MPFPKCTYNVTMHQRFCSSMNWPELFLLQWSLHHTPAIQILYHDRVPPMVSPANICIFLQELQKQHSKLQLALFFSWLIMANGKNKENEWLKDRTLKCAYSFIVVIWKTSFSCCCQGLGFEGDGRNLFCLLGFTRIMTNMVNNTLIMCHEV